MAGKPTRQKPSNGMMTLLLQSNNNINNSNNGDHPSQGAPAPAVEQEVELFQNPTLLSRLILNQKFVTATKRLHNFPTEASVWVCVKANDNTTSTTAPRKRRRRQLQRADSWPPQQQQNDEYDQDQQQQQQSGNSNNNSNNIRHLPLHIACQYLKVMSSSSPLFLFHQQQHQQQLERLIVTLVEIYPYACSKSDHYGRYPLHEAIRWNASADTISVIMMAAPEVLTRRDRNGQLPQEIIGVATSTTTTTTTNNNNNNNNQKDELVQMGLVLWEQAQLEATLRFQLGIGATMGSKTTMGGGGLKTAHNANGKDPNTNQFTTTTTTTTRDGVDDDDDDDDDDGISEKRRKNLHLERSLTLIAELYDRNNKLSEQVHAMQKEAENNNNNNTNNIESNRQLQIHTDKSAATTTSATTTTTTTATATTTLLIEMEDLVCELQKKASRQELVLRDLGVDDSGNRITTTAPPPYGRRIPVLLEEGISMMSMDPEPPTVLTKYLEHKVGELQEENEILEMENERFQIRLAELHSFVAKSEGEKKEDEGTTTTTTTAAAAAVSMLTTIEQQPQQPRPQHGDEEEEEEEEDEHDFIDNSGRIPAFPPPTGGGSTYHSRQQQQHHSHSGDEKSVSTEMHSTVSDTNYLMAKQIDDLQKQLAEAQEENEMLRHALYFDQEEEDVEGDDDDDDEEDAGNDDEEEEEEEYFDDEGTVDTALLNGQYPEEERRSGTLEDQLKGIDKLSGHGSNEMLMIDADGHPSSPDKSRRSLTSRAESKASLTSWGLLSFSHDKASKHKKERKRAPKGTKKSKWPVKTPVETVHIGEKSNETFHTQAFHESFQSFPDMSETDDLDELFKSAADIYATKKTTPATEKQQQQQQKSSSKKKVFEGHKAAAKLFGKMIPKKLRKKASRRFSDGGATPTIHSRKGFHQTHTNKVDSRDEPEAVADPFVETARLLAADEEITELIKEVEAKMGTEIPRDLVQALREASLHTASETLRANSGHSDDTFHTLHSVAESVIDYKLIEVAENIYCETIPLEIVSSLRAASAARLATSREEIAAMEMMKKRLEQELLDTLIDTAERQMHKPIPYDIVEALRSTAASFGSLLSEQCDDADMLQSVHIDFNQLDKLVKAAQELLGTPFSQEILVAIRRASFVLQSRLEGTEVTTSTSIVRDTNDLTTSPPPPPPPTTDDSTVEHNDAEELSKDSHPETNMAQQQQSLDSTAPAPAPSSRVFMSEEFIMPMKGFEDEDDNVQDKVGESSGGDRQAELGSVATASADSSLPLAALFPTLTEDSRHSKISEDSPETRWSEMGNGTVKVEPLNLDTSGSSQHSPRRRRSLEGGEDPGFMYRKARARSRSPSSEPANDLDALYDRAFRSRSRSPVSAVNNEDDLEEIYNRASIKRNISNEKRRRSSTSKEDVEEFLRSSEAAGRAESPSEPQQKTGSREADTVPNVDLSQSERSRVATSEVDGVIEAAKQILGRDISADLVAALQLVSEQSAELQTKEESKSQFESEDDSIYEETEENDDIRSQDISRAGSEVSMDIMAVFRANDPSDLEKKLKELETEEKEKTSSKRKQKQKLQSTGSDQKRMPASHHASLNFQTNRRGRSPVRGVRKVKSGDMDIFLTDAQKKERGDSLKRSKSMDLEGLVPLDQSHRSGSRSNGGALLDIPANVGSDDLDELYKHAKEKVAEGSNLLASTHHLPNQNGDAAFDTIISDTEETYGIEVPGDVVDALKKAVLGDSPDVSIIDIVRSLHEENVIRQAESYKAGPIPDDLIHAIRTSSLPPGVSMETIMPSEDAISASGSGIISASGSGIVSASGSGSVSADQSRKSSRASLSFYEASTELEETSDDSDDISVEDKQPPPTSVYESHYGSFVVSQQDLDKSQDELNELNAELVKVKSKSATGQVSGGVKPSRVRRSSKKKDEAQDLDNSGHSVSSWGKLSLSKSPATTKRKSMKSTKKHQKGTKAAMLERAKDRKEKANEFMNSLADFGTSTDDLQELYSQAKDTLQVYSPADQPRKRLPPGSPAQPSFKSARGGSPKLDTVPETKPNSTKSLETSVETSELTNIPRPERAESCIEVSPQEFELDMLLDAFQKECGDPLSVDIDIALRKASRSMDESLDFISPARKQHSQRTFGSHLPLERLEILYQEAEVFLGGEIPPDTLTALKKVASTLRGDREGGAKNSKKSRDPASAKKGGQKALQTSDLPETRRAERPVREYRSQEEPRSPRQKSDSELPSASENAMNRSNRRNHSAPLPNLVAPMPSLSTHSIDSLLSVAEGEQDDLTALYRAAYAESPRTNGSSNMSQSHRSAKSMQRLEVLQLEPPKIFSPKAASFAGTRKRSESPVVTAAVAASGASTADKAPVSPPRDMSPPVPTFSTPPKRRNVPVSVISADAHDGALERTESGRFIPNLSPMTMASMGTEGDSSKVNLKSAGARLKALSEQLPSLDDYFESTANTNRQDKVEEEEEVEQIKEQAPVEKAPSVRGSGDLSSSTSDELDAIIAEAQQQYGMELPDELIKALRKASVSTLATDGGMESFNDSNLSSLLMLKLDLLSEEDTNDDMIQRELVLNLARKESMMSEVSRFTTANAARLSPAEFFNDLLDAAEIELGRSVDPETIHALEDAFLHRTDSTPLSRVELKLRLDSALEEIGESKSTALGRAFLAGFGKITTEIVDVDSKRTKSTFGNASGYFSAVSEGEDVSVLFDGIDEDEVNAEDIFEELKNVNAAIPEELVDRLKPEPDDDDENNDSMELDALDFDYSQSTLAYSQSTMGNPASLAYSQSTMGNPASLAYSQSTVTYSAASNIMSTGPTDETADNAREEELARLKAADLTPAFDGFMARASQDYGDEFPGEVKATLRCLWESGSNLNGKFDGDELVSQAKEEFGVDLSDEMVASLERTARKSRFSLAQARELSIISALSDSGSMADSCNSSAEFNFNYPGAATKEEDEHDVDESKEVPSSEPPPPPPPPQIPGTPSSSVGTPKNVANKNMGPNLLKEVRKVYPKKLPLELSYVLSRSTALPYSRNTDDDIDIILKECEEMTGKRLPADLVLALREGSVTIRTPSNSSRSRRSRFVRQSSGSFRSTSFSSGMPSIQEWTTITSVTDMTEKQEWATIVSETNTTEKQVEVDRVPLPRNTKSIPVEITTKEKSSNDAARRSVSLPSREPLEDLASPTVPMESMVSERSSADASIQWEALNDIDGPRKASYNPSNSMGSLPALSNHAQFNNSMATQMHSNIAPPESAPNNSAVFNNSMATQMHSNRAKAQSWTPDAIEVIPAGSIESSLNTSGTSESFLTRHNSTGSSTSTEVTSNNTIHTYTTTLSNDVSVASTLTSRKLPIGVNPSPPLPDVESDDLSFIFKEAAKRFS